MEQVAERPCVLTLSQSSYESTRPTCMFMRAQEDGSKKRCHVRSTWRLFLRLHDKHGTEETMSTPLLVCNRHRATMTREQVLDDKTWMTVVRQTLAKYGFKPKKSKTELYYDRCGHAVIET